MLPRLPTASLTLSALFASPFLFSVPAYQRPFSWTMKEAGQLLEDIAAAAGVDGGDAAEPEYFLGAILLLDVEGGDLTGGKDGQTGRVFEIVDGQQRIVTLTILACCLRDLEPEGSETRKKLDALISAPRIDGDKSRRFRVQLRARAQEFFEHYVQKPGSSQLDCDPGTLGSGEKEMLGVRQLFATQLADLGEAERRVLAHFLCDRTHVVVILSRDIDGAHRLFTVLNERGRPLQRNDILKAEVFRSLPAGELEAALRQWDAAAERLGPEFEHFFSHVRVIYGRLRPQVIAAIRSIVEEVGGAKPFLERVLTPLSRAYEQILRSADPSYEMAPDIRRHLVYLNRLNGSDWVPAAMVALAEHKGDEKTATLLLKEIDRLAHVWRLLCLGTGKRVRRFAQFIEAMKAGQALAPEAAASALTREEARSIAFHLRDLHRRNALVCKLVLLRLNDELTGELTMLDPADYSVEHVLPQRPGASSLWRRWLPSGEERDSCTESLGNLVLVTHKQNDRARNQDFERKKEVYESTEGGREPLAITRDVLRADSWRASDIRAREARLLALMANMWRISGSGWDAVKSAASERRTGESVPLTGSPET